MTACVRALKQATHGCDVADEDGAPEKGHKHEEGGHGARRVVAPTRRRVYGVLDAQRRQRPKRAPRRLRDEAAQRDTRQPWRA